MAKKAKGKKKGKAKKKLTEEEKLLLLEQKALEAEELRKKKEEMLLQFLKDKLAKEEKFSRVNINKLNQKWRQIMREAKSKELKKEIAVLSQTFERVVDRKQNVIKALLKDVEEAEEQYNVSARQHFFTVDNLIDLHKGRLNRLYEEYDTELQNIKQEFAAERELVTSLHHDETRKLQDILFAMTQNHTDRETDARQEFQSIRDDIKNKNLEEKHALRIQLESAVENLWKQFQAALKNYNETTEERKNAFETLKAKDEKSSKEIETQMKKLQKIQESINLLRSKIQANTKECEERNKILRDEREFVLRHFQKLKYEMDGCRSEERKLLSKMVQHSNDCIKQLQGVAEKGDTILRCAEMCRKLETEEEKVLPFYASTLTKEEQEDVNNAVYEAPSEPLSAVMHNYIGLENFWKRYNKVLLDKLSLDQEKNVLTQENRQLRAILKQYLDGISVNDEILSKNNSLFVINERTNVRLDVPITDGRVRTINKASVLQNGRSTNNVDGPGAGFQYYMAG